MNFKTKFFCYTPALARACKESLWYITIIYKKFVNFNLQKLQPNCKFGRITFSCKVFYAVGIKIASVNYLYLNLLKHNRKSWLPKFQKSCQNGTLNVKSCLTAQ
jgi:hypothetical protein